ncbi:UBX domain-containing protein 10 [Dispira simplex]|nr:UBX domain-containing protein 10 [Dispira simplex]
MAGFLPWCWQLVTRVVTTIFTHTLGPLFTPHARITQGSPSLQDSPRLQVGEFIHDFETRYGSPRPPFLDEPYDQAIAKAKRDLRCLMVTLVSEEHDDTERFCQSLTDEAFGDFLTRHNVILWGGNVKYREAYELSGVLQASRFPFMALIVPKSRNGSVRMSVVDRIEGLLPMDQVMAQALVKIQENNESLAALRTAREERESARVLREQQNLAYMESLRADQEKERLRQEKAAQAEQQQQERLRRREARLTLEERRTRYRRYLAAHVPEEPAPGPDVGRFGIRLTTGERVTRRFRASDPVEDVYHFVDSYGVTPSDGPSDLPPGDYEHIYSFVLVSPMPRQEIPKRDLTVKEAMGDLWPSTTLIVEELEEEFTSDEDDTPDA